MYAVFRQDLNVWKGPGLPQWLKRKAQAGQTHPTRCIPGKCLQCTGERSRSELGSPRRIGENSFQRGATGGWIMSRRQKKKQHTEKTHAKLSLVRCCFLGYGDCSEIQCSMAGLTKRKFTSIRSTVTGRRDSCLVRHWTSRAVWMNQCGPSENALWFNQMKFDICSSVLCSANFGLKLPLGVWWSLTHWFCQKMPKAFSRFFTSNCCDVMQVMVLGFLSWCSVTFKVQKMEVAQGSLATFCEIIFKKSLNCSWSTGWWRPSRFEAVQLVH